MLVLSLTFFSTNGYLSFFVWDICDVCTSEEREYSPCDYSSQLADFRCPVTKLFIWIFLHLHVQVEAVLVTHQPRGSHSREQWLYSRLGCDPLLALLSVGNLVLMSKTSCSSLPPPCGAQCAIQHTLLITSFAGRNLRPAFHRAVVLGGPHLRWNCEHQEHTPQCNWLVWKLWYWLVICCF